MDNYDKSGGLDEDVEHVDTDLTNTMPKGREMKTIYVNSQISCDDMMKGPSIRKDKSCKELCEFLLLIHYLKSPTRYDICT